MNIKKLLVVILPSLVFMAHSVLASEHNQAIGVYKSPQCGCCNAWVDHLQQYGFDPLVMHPSDLNNIKEQLNIRPKYQACHTAVVDNYIFEGHIPAEVIQQFLSENHSQVLGLSVPGMPLGSPGMDNGKPFKAYRVLLLKEDGSSEIYATVSATKISYKK